MRCDTKSFTKYGNTSKNCTTTMPIITRTVAKGIPPRLREPKGKAHKKGKLNRKHTTKKRSADSESEGDKGEYTSDDSLAAYKKKKCRIKVSDSDSEDLEIVDKDTSEPPAEEVDMDEDEVEVQLPPHELEVSAHHDLFELGDSQYDRMLASMSINKERSLKKSLSRRSRRSTF
jgi:hypothetical protein